MMGGYMLNDHNGFFGGGGGGGSNGKKPQNTINISIINILSQCSPSRFDGLRDSSPPPPPPPLSLYIIKESILPSKM